jgi:REP element-mobilizing transposase RayT
VGLGSTFAGVSRPLRVLFPGAVYHVTARGNDRQPIFADDVDRTRFLSELELAVERYGLVCHGYCLMSNHYHLELETPRANLPIAMRHLNGCYTRAANVRLGRTGHLFGGRYNAVLVEKDAHLLETIRYVALNPTRTSPPLRTRPEDWPWSSYPALLGLAPTPSWLTTGWVLAQFASAVEVARGRLETFVNDALGAPADELCDGIFLAGEQLVRAKTSGLTPIPEIPRAHWQPLRPSLAEVFGARADPILSAYREYGYTLREIAAHVGCSYSTISRRLRASERAA